MCTTVKENVTLPASCLTASCPTVIQLTELIQSQFNLREALRHHKYAKSLWLIFRILFIAQK